MVLTRRHALHVAAGGLLSSLAGCSGYESPAPPGAETETRITDYESVVVRDPNGERVVRYEADDGETRSTAYLDSAAEAARVSFAARVDGVDAASAFIDETAFDRESVLFTERDVPECRRFAVSFVTRARDSFDVEFCSPLRPADVACETERRDVAAAFVRLPFPGDDVTSYGVGGGGGGCELPSRLRTTETGGPK